MRNKRESQEHLRVEERERGREKKSFGIDGETDMIRERGGGEERRGKERCCSSNLPTQYYYLTIVW